jgi:hypothetical protein
MAAAAGGDLSEADPPLTAPSLATARPREWTDPDPQLPSS